MMMMCMNDNLNVYRFFFNNGYSSKLYINEYENAYSNKCSCNNVNNKTHTHTKGKKINRFNSFFNNTVKIQGKKNVYQLNRLLI